MAEAFIHRYLKAGTTSISNLLLHHYHEIGMTTSQLMVYLELKSYLDHGIEQPSLKAIADHLGTSEEQVNQLIHEMVSQKFITQRLVPTKSGKDTAVYDFTGLIDQLTKLDADQNSKTINDDLTTTSREEIFKQIQVEFGRTLSPMELQYVNQWIDQDHYSTDLIHLALKESVVNGKYTLKYMDRILLRWQQSNLTTPQAVEADRQSYEQLRQARSQSSHEMTEKIPIFKLNDQ